MLPLPQKEVCCADSSVQVEAKLEGSVTLCILLTLWGAKCHSVTFWVFLSADSTP